MFGQIESTSSKAVASEEYSTEYKKVWNLITQPIMAATTNLLISIVPSLPKNRMSFSVAALLYTVTTTWHLLKKQYLIFLFTRVG